MRKDYWEKLAASFEKDVFDVLGNDRRGIIRRRLRQAASKERSVGDFGCGVGRHLAMLSRLFGSVVGVDISPKCLRIARARSRDLDNVRLRQADLTNGGRRLPKVDVGFSINVAMMPPPADRRAVLKNIAGRLTPGGTLLLVVPSAESAMLTDRRLIDWNLRQGASPAEAAAESEQQLAGRNVSVPRGILNAGGTPTKHFLKEELQLALERTGLTARKIEKVTYPWTTEFAEPPDWMNAPYPWDWLATAEKAAS